ncbi:hypothetical protein [Candidatus Tisiphia endosymbiont of Nemotelus uliginosus]|uniref:hypothetical protein n=1 Tax=Candidatus Tisiphia endosymbiont of Nemotelus uliginosus TaxID=3077926 RepID=UPI0035C922AD
MSNKISLKFTNEVIAVTDLNSDRRTWAKLAYQLCVRSDYSAFVIAITQKLKLKQAYNGNGNISL